MSITRRRATAFAVLGGFALLVIVGAALFVTFVAFRSDSAAYTCPESEEEFWFLDPTFSSLPPLEVVRVDFPISRASGVWRHWDGGMLKVRAVSLNPGGDKLWLGLNPGLASWDLSALRGEPVDVRGVTAVDSIVPIGSNQFWASGTMGVVRYDRGSWEVLPKPDTFFNNPPLEGGVDKEGALWVNYAGWMQCEGYPADWYCAGAVERETPLVLHLVLCVPALTSLDFVGFLGCVTGPKQVEAIPLQPPSDSEWQAVSAPMRHVTWDRGCSDQLVFLSLEPRQVVKAVPWPAMVRTADVRWAVYNQNQAWIFSDDLWVFEAGRWNRFEWPYELPSGAVADPRGDGVWMGVPELGLIQVSQDATRLYHPRDRLYAPLVDRGWEPARLGPRDRGWLAVASLAETSDGHIWAGTDGGGLWVYDEKEALWQPTELTQAFVDVLLADSDGGLWIGTRDGGLAHYDGKDTWRWWRTYSGLPSDIVTALALNQQGRLWMGTKDGGLAWFDGDTWERVDAEVVPHDERITALLVDQENRVFFGYGDGVGMYDDDGWTVPLGEGLPSRHPDALALDSMGNLWASCAGYLYVLSDAGWSLSPTPERKIQELLFDSRGRLWEGGSALRLRESGSDQWRLLHYTDDVYAMLEDSHGRIWVAKNWGVSMYDPALGELEFLE